LGQRETLNRQKWSQLQAEKDRIDELVKQVKKLTERVAELEAKNAAQAEKIASVEKEQKNAPAVDDNEEEW
jgi:uncharacterized protein YoxC